MQGSWSLCPSPQEEECIKVSVGLAACSTERTGPDLSREQRLRADRASELRGLQSAMARVYQKEDELNISSASLVCGHRTATLQMLEDSQYP